MIGGVVYVDHFKLSRSTLPSSQAIYDVTGLSIERFNEIVNCDKPIVCKEIVVTDPVGLNVTVKNITTFILDSEGYASGILVGVSTTTFLIVSDGYSVVAIIP